MQSRGQHRRVLRNHRRRQCRGLQLLQHTTAGPQSCSPWRKITDLKIWRCRLPPGKYLSIVSVDLC
jgi:hypothetical protein